MIRPAQRGRPRNSSRPKSQIWKYFIRHADRNGGTCLKCLKDVGGCNSNTTNLWKHWRMHNTEPSTAVASAPDSSERFGEIGERTPAKSKTTILRGEDMIDNHLMWMICRHNMPYNVTEWEALGSLVNLLMPHYTIPSSATIARLVDERARCVRDSMKAALREIEHLSLTVDLWDDSPNSKSYLGTTAHFYDERLVKRTVHLKTIDFLANDSGEKIAEKLMKMCAEWGIDLHRVIGVTHKNVTVINEAVEIAFSKDKSISCMSHAISLLANNCINEAHVRTLIGKVKKVVAYFEENTTARENLRLLQNPHDNLAALQLFNGITWKLVCYRLERFLLIANDMSTALENCDGPEIIAQEEISKIRDIVSLLHILDVFSKKASGDTHVPVSQTIPLAQALRASIDGISMVTSLGNSVKTTIVRMMKNNQPWISMESSPVVAAATILDPRFKKVVFRNAASSSGAVTYVEEILRDMDSNADEQAMNQDVEVKTEEDDPFASFMNKYHKQQSSTAARHQSDLSRYLDEPILLLNNDSMKFWRDFGSEKNVAKLAMKYPCVAASSDLMERLFTNEGDIIAPDRSTLTPEQLTNIIFRYQLKKNDFGL